MSEKSGDIYEMLDAMRARPALYLGESSLTLMWVFLMGYQFALQDHEISFREVGPWSFGFHHYVGRRLNQLPINGKGYHLLILQHVGGDEAKALELFWQLLDDFRAEQAGNETKIIHD